jgi:hypothetical protein
LLVHGSIAALELPGIARMITAGTLQRKCRPQFLADDRQIVLQRERKTPFDFFSSLTSIIVPLYFAAIHVI